jgi:hypothetical protein
MVIWIETSGNGENFFGSYFKQNPFAGVFRGCSAAAEENQKFFSAPAKNVVGFFDAVTDDIRDRTKNLVSICMSVCIIDLFEIVDIKQSNRTGTLVVRVFGGLLKDQIQSSPIQQVSQRVVIGKLLQFTDQKGTAQFGDDVYASHG